LSAFQNIADTLYALDEDAKTLEAAVRAEAAAKKTLDLTQQQIAAGAVNAFALLLAEQAYRQTTVTRIGAQANRLTNTAALFQSLGGTWE
jgi:outer membrane protein TolC